MRCGSVEPKIENRGNAKQIGQVHCPGIVSKQESRSRSSLINCASVVNRSDSRILSPSTSATLSPLGAITSGAEENPLNRESPCNLLRHLCEAWPLFCRSVFRARQSPNLNCSLRSVIEFAGEIRRHHSPQRAGELEIPVGLMNDSDGNALARRLINQPAPPMSPPAYTPWNPLPEKLRARYAKELGKRIATSNGGL